MITLSKEASLDELRNLLSREFAAWFKTVPVDFWDECNAPDELADIAIRRLEVVLFKSAGE